MAVLVDNVRIPFGRMLMCHMFADTRDELLAMMQKIRLSPSHLQAVGTTHEHCDVCVQKRELALRAGAVPVTAREVVALVQARRAAGRVPPKRGIVAGPRTTTTDLSEEW